MPTIVKGNDVTKKQAADIFGVYVTTIDDWVRRGCPSVEKGGRGKPWTFNTASLFKWRLQEEVDKGKKAEPVGEDLDLKIKQARLRLTDAQADNEEIKAKLAANEVINAELLSVSLANLFGLIRNKILSIPERVETSLVGETDKDRFKEVLTTELKEAMIELSDHSIESLSLNTQGESDE